MMSKCLKKAQIPLRYVRHPHTGVIVSSKIEEISMKYGINILDSYKFVSISTENGFNIRACMDTEA